MWCVVCEDKLCCAECLGGVSMYCRDSWMRVGVFMVSQRVGIIVLSFV